jgi:hypothetical protein
MDTAASKTSGPFSREEGGKSLRGVLSMPVFYPRTGAKMARKRGNGEESIYPVKDKSGRVTGCRGSSWVHTKASPKRRYLSGKRREDVANKLTKALANRADGLVFDAGTLTVGEYLDR